MSITLPPHTWECSCGRVIGSDYKECPDCEYMDKFGLLKQEADKIEKKNQPDCIRCGKPTNRKYKAKYCFDCIR